MLPNVSVLPEFRCGPSPPSREGSSWGGGPGGQEVKVSEGRGGVRLAQGQQRAARGGAGIWTGPD